MLSILERFITHTSTTIPHDILEAMEKGKMEEEKNSSAEIALHTILKSIKKSQEKTVPVCQDTGFLSFFVKIPTQGFENNTEISQKKIKENILQAVKNCTQKGVLRPNAVDSLTGKNSGDNLGEHFPKIVFSESEDENIHIDLILKGGGSENVSGQMALPCETDFGQANRNLEGVEKAVLQIVKNAEGKGCAPGVLGVHIGADRAVGFEMAKKNLFRQIGDRSENEELSVLESKILEKANEMKIGPMGFGGKTTLLDVFCSASHRLPASFFVTVAYSCWALRRQKIIISPKNEIVFLSNHSMSSFVSIPNDNTEDWEKNCKTISFPTTPEKIADLNIGDVVLVSGKIFTGRDVLHHAVVEKNLQLPENTVGGCVFHCGPVVQKQENAKTEWKILSAGPTTSIREEPYEAEFMEKTQILGIIGKGRMGKKTQEALEKNGGVYLHAIGGAAAEYADAVEKVLSVHFLEEFGVPEAMWNLEVKNFLCVVTMKA